MKVSAEGCKLFFTTSCLLLISGLTVHSLSHSYDDSATTECLAEPQREQYGGGIIVNPAFDHSLEGWTMVGNGAIEKRRSNEGNAFIVARNRTKPLDSFSQKVQLKKGMIYTFSVIIFPFFPHSAWLQLSKGSETVSVVFKIHGSELIRGGHVIAKHGCWTLLKGGLVANFTSPADILFESKNPTVEIWADSVSLQPFTKEEWRSHQEDSIERVRKRKVRFQVTHINETALEGATISIKQTRPHFPFGCGMNNNILTNSAYRKWFMSRFKHTTFTNQMKWYSTEKVQGQENYTIPDAMLALANDNGISVRGHTILWDDRNFQPEWVKSLSPQDLREAARKRINSVVSRYKGDLIAWDVVNENLHYNFYEQNFGENASAMYYSTAYHLDPNARMFLNEFNTIEYSGDVVANPANYIRKIREIQQFPGTKGIPLGIGLQCHFASGNPNLAYMRSGLDILGATGYPIWLTETSIDPQPNQEEYFEWILREGYSHPAVQGIIMFMGPVQAGFQKAPLADENFTNTPMGDVVDKLIREWGTGPHETMADSRGIVDISLHHGDYDVIVSHPQTHFSKTLNLSVRKEFSQQTIHVKMHA
ncbi:endo-1,4-beta-xylanase 5-like [Lotus japonicus]|uniref:endo-1,4-beta-xylanase 5-like n=1 Tax=Lotus japonicus TaxID=34305 RepID=UPI002586054C|nr:endo-1,4-beta-xylanase 5-like [Lotus japonicus]